MSLFIGQNLRVKTITTTPYVATGTEDIILVDCTSGAITVTLPSAVGITGKTLEICKIDSTVNTVTIATTGGQLINGLSSLTIYQAYVPVKAKSYSTLWVAEDYNKLIKGVINNPDITMANNYTGNNSIGTTMDSWMAGPSGFTVQVPSTGIYKIGVISSILITPASGSPIVTGSLSTSQTPGSGLIGGYFVIAATPTKTDKQIFGFYYLTPQPLSLSAGTNIYTQFFASSYLTASALTSLMLSNPTPTGGGKMWLEKMPSIQ